MNFKAGILTTAVLLQLSFCAFANEQNQVNLQDDNNKIKQNDAGAVKENPNFKLNFKKTSKKYTPRIDYTRSKSRMVPTTLFQNEQGEIYINR